MKVSWEGAVAPPTEMNGEIGLPPLHQTPLQWKQTWQIIMGKARYWSVLRSCICSGQFIAPCSALCKLWHLEASQEFDQLVSILGSLCIAESMLFVLLGLLARGFTLALFLSHFSQQCFINLLHSPCLEGSVLFPILIFMVHKILTSLTRKNYGH